MAVRMLQVVGEGMTLYEDSMHILVVEDEPKVSRALKEGLQEQGYTVSSQRRARRDSISSILNVSISQYWM